jgi:hypothetical protein
MIAAGEVSKLVCLALGVQSTSLPYAQQSSGPNAILWRPLDTEESTAQHDFDSLSCLFTRSIPVSQTTQFPSALT